MSYQITLPPEWTLPGFSFLQRVKFHENRLCCSAEGWGHITTTEVGTIIGLEYHPHSDWDDLKPGWWYNINLDEDSPGWQPHSTEMKHENSLRLIEQQEVAA